MEKEKEGASAPVLPWARVFLPFSVILTHLPVDCWVKLIAENASGWQVVRVIAGKAA